MVVQEEKKHFTTKLLTTWDCCSSANVIFAIYSSNVGIPVFTAKMCFFCRLNVEDSGEDENSEHKAGKEPTESVSIMGDI